MDQYSMEIIFIIFVIIVSLIASVLCAAFYRHLHRKFSNIQQLLTEEEDQKVEERAQLLAKEYIEKKARQASLQPGATVPKDDFDVNQPRENHIPYLSSILKDIGCNIEVDNEGNTSFKYQGEEFFVEYNGIYLRIWDPSWARIETDNPNFRDVLKAVNEANYGFGPTVVFTLPDTSGSVALHSRYDIYFPAFMKNDPGFLKMSLNLFFDTKHNLAGHLREINDKGINLPNPALLNPLIPSSN
ncbi:MAG: hypothetical protein K2J48_04170 [Muribaculaceae bacterium]|nr:hypothetical protein [Muribaculaceae bacterium]